MQLVDPARQNRLANKINLVILVTRLGCKILHKIEGNVVLEQMLMEGRVNQRRCVVRRNEVFARDRRALYATMEAGEGLLIIRHLVVHQRTQIDTLRSRFGVSRLLRGNGDDVVMIDPGGQIDGTSEIPDLLQGLLVIDVLAIRALDHHGDRQWISEPRMILEGLHEGVICRQQIGEDGANFDGR